MLPIQILLNNLLYDLSEMPIPTDDVDPESMVQPRHWDIRFIRNFMLVLGPVSSLFDFLTFGLLLFVFGAGQALFQTGWFIESLATQVLVIFVIRTRRSPLQSRPSPYLAATAACGGGRRHPASFHGARPMVRLRGAAALPSRGAGGDARRLSGAGGSGEALVLSPAGTSQPLAHLAIAAGAAATKRSWSGSTVRNGCHPW